ncbi:MAG: DUF6439 family protein [Cyanobacteria bacterium P01_F01_bin.150]
MAQQPLIKESFKTPEIAALDNTDTAILARTLATRLAISSQDWHRLKGNRPARAKEQVAIALNYLLNDQTEDAMAHLQQAVGWLDKSLSSPSCSSVKK